MVSVLPVFRRTLFSAVPLALVVALVATPTAQAEDRPTGPDISSHQHVGGAPIDWQAVKDAGHDFGMIKATEGTDYVNPYFNDDTARMRAAGVLRGAYHFPVFGESPEMQAIHYVTTVFPQNVMGSLPPLIAVERSNGASAATIINWLHRWLNVVEVMTGKKAIIYTTEFWEDGVNDTHEFSQYPLWISDWGKDVKDPYLVGGWTNWVFWQTTDAATIPGISVPCDSNVYNGTLGPLTEWATQGFYGM
ncbi:glycoside hydrolase family 25 protein [Antrihabitans sp. YC2-6]|uniref:glycoside hydrolase family 25 protein n=1 Tax=Antrihabitans sp. YC2-6 TaxID=2799498 RepID=UPI0018F5BBD3|nr:glycoside hydrolase family 25 protein [Antrihabitans sp. YC2-6]MBJ8345693.1 glycoside hydrolase family 25 protein [Antrihabitans sp. YC2-6]